MNGMTKHQACKSCLFFMAREHEVVNMQSEKRYDGLCRRYPPQLSGNIPARASVNGTNWCGEWELSPKAVEPEVVNERGEIVNRVEWEVPG